MDFSTTSSEVPGADHSDDSPIVDQVRAIRESGFLVRSPKLVRLFDYLDTCHLARRVPKEFEIAVEVLGRHDGFDVTQDALVRVYVHKLRRKLDDYYRQPHVSTNGRLIIPKGEYRLAWEALALPEPASPPPQRLSTEAIKRFRLLVSGLALLLLLSLLWNFAFLFDDGRGRQSEEGRELRDSALWAPLFADDKPVVVVVGDYYLFAESDDRGRVGRLVRDFDINSPVELAQAVQQNPSLGNRQFDVGLSYLPTGIAHALHKLDLVLNSGSKKPWGVILSSELVSENIRNSHIVYIGHLSGMRVLEDLVFATSGFRVGRSYDQLVDKASGRSYVSGNGIPTDAMAAQVQLAYLASFTGAAGNRVLIVAGFRDIGLKGLADLLSSRHGVAELLAQQTTPSFEALYQFSGLGAMNAPGKILVTRPLTAGEGD